jgi:hypothetical protein
MIGLLKRALGLDWFDDVDLNLRLLDEQMIAVKIASDRLELWIGALDAALFRVDQTVSGTALEQVTELKDLAASIRSEMDAAKRPFPVQLEDLK